MGEVPIVFKGVIMNKVDLTGKKYGKLTVIKFAYTTGKARYWECLCDCGNKVNLKYGKITSGHTKSCGCLHKEICKQMLTKHDKYYTNIYRAYICMKDRCLNPNNSSYKRYGGRGISICKEWLGEEGFLNFYNWAINNGHKDNLSIDRIDNNGNYEPSNCRWVDKLAQANNRSKNKIITYKNESHTLSNWARVLNIPYYLLQSRIKNGMCFEKAIKNVDYRKCRSKNEI